MAASATTLSTSRSSPFSSDNVHEPKTSVQQPEASALIQLANSAFQRSVPSQSPPLMMTPRFSPQPTSRSDDRDSTKITNPSSSTALENAANAGKEAALKMSKPLIEVDKLIKRNENGSGPTTAQVSPTSMSSFASLEESTTATSSVPAIAPPPAVGADAATTLPGSESGRPVVDPGLTNATEAMPSNRSFTFPPPLNDAFNTPGARNHSLPNNVFPADSPRSASGKRHKCPYCSTEFTRHHNLKSHLLTHSQEKPYECQQCNARFRRLHDLKRHTKLHTGERPHICPSCNRKFARGDALARHSKGPGGCAGKRPSFIEEDPSGSRTGDDTMDGIEYTAEPDSMNDDDPRSDQRGATDPALRNTKRHESYRPNTYPGIAPPGPSHGLYPPSLPRPQEGSSAGPSVSTSSVHQFNAPVFPQSGMTESPKPISPGQSNDRSLSSARAMSSHFGSSNRGGSPMTLPPPQVSGAPQLPALQAFHPPAPPGGPSSHPGSLSSSHHSGGSGASTREILGIPSELRGIIADLEGRLNESRIERDNMIAQLRNEHARADQEHRQQITILRDEIDRLKSQLAEQARA